MPGARERAIERDASRRTRRARRWAAGERSTLMDGPDDATASACVNALDLFRFTIGER